MSTLFLNNSNVKSLLNMAEVIEAVEQAFRDWEQGKAIMPAKTYLVVDKGDFRGMPAAIPGAAGIKWVNVHTQNPTAGLPTVMAILIYSDPSSGYPLAVMEATDITAYRTGAAAAIASKYLARKEAHTLGIIGAGQQAYTQLLAHAELFDLQLIRVHDLFEAAVTKFIRSFPQYKIKACSPEEVLTSDIVCTITPAREPIVRQEWVMPGVHINAIGADAKGKEELAPAILKEAVIIVDEIKQASSGGEINVPLSNGLLKAEDIYATLGEIITGAKTGRIDDKQITVFDSTGVAIEDIALLNWSMIKPDKPEITCLWIL